MLITEVSVVEYKPLSVHSEINNTEVLQLLTMKVWWSSLLLSCLVSSLQGKSVKKGLCIPPGENFHCGDLAAFRNVRLGFTEISINSKNKME